MKIFLSTLLVLASATAILTAEPSLVVTPSSLDGWTVTGADRTSLAACPQLLLPAGSQLGRQFPGGAIVLHLVSTPVISADSADWPILEVGPVALAAVADNHGGKIMLVVNESVQVELPWKIPSSPNPTSLDLLLAYDPVSGAGLIGMQNDMRAFDAGASTRPVEVILSAGATHAWPCDQLELWLLSADAIEVTSPATTQASERARTPSEKLRSLVEQLTGERDSGAGPTPSVVTPFPVATAVGGLGARLEVFTPPAFRHSRAAEVRSIIAKRQAK